MRAGSLLVVAALSGLGCSASSPQSASASGGASSSGTPGAGGPSSSADWNACNSVRLTTYAAGDVAWCAFDRRAPMLPDFVRNGLTIAIPEPWNGSSYGGDPGEACGECWEITSLSGTRTVMVHDLCPIQGNPLCTGDHFDFDVADETGAALGLDGLDEGRARRVPCPVTGNAFLSLLGRDEWGSVRFQVINERFPVRSIEYHAVGSSVYYAAERSAAAWAVSNDHRDMFDKDGAGGSFRLTSARGEVVETPNVLTYDRQVGDYFDLGGQFTGDLPQTGGACRFVPPGDVYVDGYGGIPSAGWVINPWGSASPSEVTTGCVSGSCLRVAGLSPGMGFHIFYRQPFSPSLFKTLHFSVRSESGTGTVDASLTSDNSPACQTQSVPVTETWSEASLPLASLCAGVDVIRNVTFNGVTPLTVYFDDIRFEE